VGRPSELELRAASALLAPWRALTDPRFFGLEHVPRAGPMLLVGNHTVFGLVDLPPMLIGLFEASGVYARGLADHAHFKVPLWGEFLARFGAVDGTRENARRLLGDDEAVLVLPGGAREVTKRKGEAYTLIWKQRLGFARLAIERGCPVVPFGSVGAEESFDCCSTPTAPRCGRCGPCSSASACART
jgi:1-acyl-sn-glycerol-3-phosphate acyltransferase